MKCEACDKAPATVHLTEIVNKKKRELHLCEGCAREKGVSVKAVFHDAGEKPEPKTAPPPGVLAALEKIQHGQLQRIEELAGISCPICGLTFAEFRASGRLGCANDYMAFKRGLVPLLEKIHSQVEHKGKVPAHVGQRMERQKKLVDLRRERDAAVQREDYEQAARLRDEIYALENEEKS